jgi:hypothetical protein
MRNRNRKQPNALKHGAFAKMAIIPGEDPEEFAQLHSALIKEWAPDGPTEEDAVLNIAKAVWRKRRSQKLIQAAIDVYVYTDPKHPSYDEALALELFYDAIEDHPDDDGRIFFLLKEVTADHLRQKFPRNTFQTSLEWVRAMQNEITSSLLPAVKLRSEPQPEYRLVKYLESVSETDFFREIDLDARIDPMIEPSSGSSRQKP